MKLRMTATVGILTLVVVGVMLVAVGNDALGVLALLAPIGAILFLGEDSRESELRRLKRDDAYARYVIPRMAAGMHPSDRALFMQQLSPGAAVWLLEVLDTPQKQKVRRRTKREMIADCAVIGPR